MHQKPKFTEKVCQHHGVTEFVLEGRGFYRCKKCRSDAVTRRRQKCKRMLIEQFGGKCSVCGYCRCVAALEFHHIDRSTKEFAVSHEGCSISYARMLKEAEKCVLVCANCHAEIEAGVTSIN